MAHALGPSPQHTSPLPPYRHTRRHPRHQPQYTSASRRHLGVSAASGAEEEVVLRKNEEQAASRQGIAGRHEPVSMSRVWRDQEDTSNLLRLFEEYG